MLNLKQNLNQYKGLHNFYYFKNNKIIRLYMFHLTFILKYFP